MMARDEETKAPVKEAEDPRLNDDLRKEITDRFKYATSYVKDWDEIAKDDMNFGLGDQWSEEERTALKDASRPALTFNRIKPIITIISGYQRENASRIKISPEGGEDKIFSEVLDRVIKFIDKVGHLFYKMSYWFDDGLYTGKGWLEAVRTYESDPIRGELRFLQRTPYQIIVDPDFNEYDLNEWPRAQYVFKVVRLGRDVLKELYPKSAALIDGFVSDVDDVVMNGAGLLKEGADDDYGNRPNSGSLASKARQTDETSGLKMDDKFTVKEYWRPKSIDKFFVIDKETSEPKKFDTEEEAQAFSAQQGFGTVTKRQAIEMWCAPLVAGFIMQDEKSDFEPYTSAYPFFRFLADWSPSAESEILKVQGVVRSLKDPQREKNKSKSQNLHILNTQANSGWIGDEEALTPEGWKQLEQMGAKPGITVKKKKGYELREILPKGPNQGHLQREQTADEEFKQISAVNPDLMGMQEGTSSGRAIAMRIKQAVLSLVRIFHNYRYSKEIIGKFILEMIPALFDEKKMAKVLGPQYMRSATDPQLYPEGLTEGHLKAYLTMIKDNKFDVLVSEADQNKTIRFEIFQDLMELAKIRPDIPTELLIDYMDLSNSEEVKKKIREQQQMAMAAQAAQQKPQA
jgi:hypothetical protein